MLRYAVIFGVIGVSAWLAGASPASAERKHVSHYSAYNTALEAGDVNAAVEHAEAAWRAAENELGDHQTTAVLAYNFANMIYATQPERAVDPLTRVVALTGEQDEMFGAEAPIVMLRYVEALADPNARNKKETLRTLLTAHAEAGVPMSLCAARAWQHLSVYDLGRQRFLSAQKASDVAIANFKAAASDLQQELANALITGGVARIGGRARDRHDIEDAAALFKEAIESFPQQKNIETFNPSLAQAMAWLATAQAAGQAMEKQQDAPAASRLHQRGPDIDSDYSIKWAPGADRCPLNFAKRHTPIFPVSDAVRGYLGAVVIGYHIGPNKKVTGERILAEVPARSKFSEATLKAMKKWETVSPPGPNCGRNNLSTVRFTFD